MSAMKISSRKGDPCVPERGHRACQHRDSGMRGEKPDRVMPTVGHGKSGNDGNSGNDRDGANRTAGAVRSGVDACVESAAGIGGKSVVNPIRML